MALDLEKMEAYIFHNALSITVYHTLCSIRVERRDGEWLSVSYLSRESYIRAVEELYNFLKGKSNHELAL